MSNHELTSKHGGRTLSEMIHTRRQFMGRMTALGSTFALAPSTAFAKKTPLPEVDIPPPGAPTFFTQDERLALAAMAEHILPGSSAWGVVSYMETFVTAFEYTPPRIYAGGPFSGRQPIAPPGTEPVPNDFANFLPLNRVQEKTWKLFLYGSAGVPGGIPNQSVVGPVVGLRDLLKQGLQHAAKVSPKKVHQLSPSTFGWLWNLLHPAFKDAVVELVLEGSLAAPEYGGNKDLGGWKLVHFSGDVLPAGYSTYNPVTQSYDENPEQPVSMRDPGPDPDQLSFFTRLVFRAIALVIGRNF